MCTWKERFQNNNLTLHIEKLEKQEQTKPKARRRKKVIKIRDKNREQNIIEKIMKWSLFLKKINKID